MSRVDDTMKTLSLLDPKTVIGGEHDSILSLFNLFSHLFGDSA